MTSRTSTGRTSIIDVAKAAGVSRQTVSNVVNRPERVRVETRQRVQQVIEQLGYRPSLAAKSLRAQRAGAVGIELNSLGERNRSDIVYPFLIELTVAAPRYGVHMVPFASAEDRPMLSGYEDMVITHLVDAFIIADTHHADPRPAWLSEHEVPFAAFGRIWDDPSFTGWADVNGAVGTRSAVEHLLDRGYQRLGFLGWPEGSGTGDDRRQGWATACAEAGIDDESLVASSAQDLNDAVAAARDLVQRVGRGGAVVCASDLLAVGALAVLRELGWVPGSDFGVVGFDDSPLAGAYALTTIGQPLREIADHVLHTVFDQLASKPLPACGSLVDPYLVPRTTTRRRAWSVAPV